MLDTLDALIATVAVIFIMSLVVQAVQQIIKQLFSFKSRYMEKELLSMFGAVGPSVFGRSFDPADLAAPIGAGLARRDEKNQHIVAIIDGLKKTFAGFGYNDLSLLEKVSKADFLRILNQSGMRLLDRENPDLRAAVQKAVDDAKEWYDFTLKAFQDHYERRMKLWAYVIGFVLVAMLNLDIFDVYQEFQSNRVLRESALKAVGAVMEDYDAAGLADTEAEDPASAAEIRAEIDAQLETIDSLVGERAFHLWRWEGGRKGGRTWGGFFATIWGNLPGIILMGLLVGLGAPFWYDILRAVMGLKQRASSPPAEPPAKVTGKLPNRTVPLLGKIRKQV